MKGRDRDAVRAMSEPELRAKLAAAEEAHFRQVFRHASHPLKNPLQIRIKRREIARLKTWLREMEQGRAG